MRWRIPRGHDRYTHPIFIIGIFFFVLFLSRLNFCHLDEKFLKWPRGVRLHNFKYLVRMKLREAGILHDSL